MSDLLISYEKIRSDLLISYEKIRSDLLISYEKIRSDLLISYEKIRSDLLISYEKITKWGLTWNKNHSHDMYENVLMGGCDVTFWNIVCDQTYSSCF